ncbi:unnamed protein product [Linum trigynum]|uniref:Uncharacterized protein n=1 Tax=Linum trigynum TaxID=586398 RepID=A0AAV2D5R8_9ROSI
MPMMKEASCWSIRNGETTRFWRHPWIENGLILEDYLIKEITKEERSLLCLTGLRKELSGIGKGLKSSSLMTSSC